MKRFLFVLVVAAAVAAALGAYLSRPIKVPETSGTWQPAEHEPVTS
ncbi:MAG: hypothetical protein ACR2NL_08545 [Acidimicrobiia bacterium]